MYTQRQLIKFGLCAERAHRLALDIAFSAAELSHFGKGMAIVADETRNIGIKLHSLFDNDSIDEAEIANALLQLKFLAVNGCLEMMRLNDTQLILKKRIAVILDEINNLVTDIENIFGIKQALPLVHPKISEKNKVISNGSIFNTGIRFVVFSVGGMQFCEAATNVLEVFFHPYGQSEKSTEDGFVSIRGERLPLVNYYEKLSADPKEGRALLRVRAEYQDESKEYAVAIDGVPDVFFSGIGVNTPPVGVDGELVRECWACEEDRQMVFLEYDAQ